MKNLGFALILSSLCHLILLFFIFYSNSFFSSDKKVLIESAIQVDQIGLPDFQKEVQKTKVQQKKKSEPKKIQKSIKKTPVKNKKPPKKLSEKKAEKESAQEKPKESVKEASDKSSPNEIQKGNQISEGAGTGDRLNSEQMDSLNSYANQILTQTKDYWNLPNYLMNEKRSAQVEIKIDAFGNLTYKQIIAPSGSELYDSLVLKAIGQAAPYPKPPKSVQKFIKDGIVLIVPSQ